MSSECFTFDVHQISTTDKFVSGFYLWVTLLSYSWMISNQLCYKSTNVNDLWPTLLQIDPCEWSLTNFVINWPMKMIFDRVWRLLLFLNHCMKIKLKKKIHICHDQFKIDLYKDKNFHLYPWVLGKNIMCNFQLKITGP